MAWPARADRVKLTKLRINITMCISSEPRLASCPLGRLVVSHRGMPSSFTGGVAPRFSHVRITPDDDPDRRVFSGISRYSAFAFRHCSILTSLHVIGSQDLDVKRRPNSLCHSRRRAVVPSFLTSVWVEQTGRGCRGQHTSPCASRRSRINKGHFIIGGLSPSEAPKHCGRADKARLEGLPTPLPTAVDEAGFGVAAQWTGLADTKKPWWVVRSSELMRKELQYDITLLTATGSIHENRTRPTPGQIARVLVPVGTPHITWQEHCTPHERRARRDDGAFNVCGDAILIGLALLGSGKRATFITNATTPRSFTLLTIANMSQIKDTYGGMVHSRSSVLSALNILRVAIEATPALFERPIKNLALQQDHVSYLSKFAKPQNFQFREIAVRTGHGIALQPSMDFTYPPQQWNNPAGQCTLSSAQVVELRKRASATCRSHLVRPIWTPNNRCRYELLHFAGLQEVLHETRPVDHDSYHVTVNSVPYVILPPSFLDSTCLDECSQQNARFTAICNDENKFSNTDGCTDVTYTGKTAVAGSCEGLSGRAEAKRRATSASRTFVLNDTYRGIEREVWKVLYKSRAMAALAPSCRRLCPRTTRREDRSPWSAFDACRARCRESCCETATAERVIIKSLVGRIKAR
ncbi:hypothetical protein PR048_017672 [Dryococelus australis]|uniref:Uncharacterized protein n=1 Tax=Dryococelus australis TaxID=614101 RepID=A0ABQ9HA91_9NEOP|nr:hypothetical protein PR048_017672 [Dryococelus australis]